MEGVIFFPKVFENLIFRTFLTDYLLILENHANVFTSCLQIKLLRILSNKGHLTFLQRRQHYGTCVPLGGDDQVPRFLYSFHNLGSIFASFTTSHTFSLIRRKNHAKNIVSCVLLKLSRFDSLHSGTSIVCFWMPSCSSLWTFPVHGGLWRSRNGSGGADFSKHSS